jgi:hypothetical protein
LLSWFVKVLDVILYKEDLKCVWLENYDRSQIPWEVSGQRPLIVDPANPYNNVAGGLMWPEMVACAAQFREILARKYRDLITTYDKQPKVIP